MKSIPARTGGKAKNKKVERDLYVRKYNENAILNRMKMDPPMRGFFQEMNNMSRRIKDGIECMKKAANFLMNGAFSEKTSRAKSDKNTIKIMASTLGIQMSLPVFIFPSFPPISPLFSEEPCQYRSRTAVCQANPPATMC
jgi:hypothetical protein